jgi:hypothetical protein
MIIRELSRATPQLQFAGERLAARLLRTAKGCSLRYQYIHIYIHTIDHLGLLRHTL